MTYTPGVVGTEQRAVTDLAGTCSQTAREIVVGYTRLRDRGGLRLVGSLSDSGAPIPTHFFANCEAK
jgi:hypothetical protein